MIFPLDKSSVTVSSVGATKLLKYSNKSSNFVVSTSACSSFVKRLNASDIASASS